MQGPQEGPEFGIASLITNAIQSAWSNVQMYNELSVAARMEGFDEIANIIDEINTNESKHIGHLQSALKIVSPNAEAIELGNEEGSEILSNPIK
jgi:rubrerythrin